jgi:hypothetical protein
MAIDVETGKLVTPYGGRPDLEARMLKHPSDAFAEDPLRVYRVARFALLVHDLGKGLSENPPVHNGHDSHEHLVRSLGARLRNST